MMHGKPTTNTSQFREPKKFGWRGVLVTSTWAAGIAVIGAVAAPSADAQRRRGFDAVGGGAASAMSFGQGGGVAWRIYPAGAKDGFQASSQFQSYKAPALIQRMQGMEGKIWGENLWMAQEEGDKRRAEAKRRLAAEQRNKRVRRQPRLDAESSRPLASRQGVPAAVVRKRSNDAQTTAARRNTDAPSTGEPWWRSASKR